MLREADAVAAILPYDAVTLLGSLAEDRSADVVDAATADRLQGRCFQALPGGPHQFPPLGRRLAHCECPGGVTEVPVAVHPEVDLDQITPLEPPWSGYPVYHFVVHRSADGTGEVEVAQKGGSSPLLDDDIPRISVYLRRGDPLVDQLREPGHCFRQDHT